VEKLGSVWWKKNRMSMQSTCASINVITRGKFCGELCYVFGILFIIIMLPAMTLLVSRELNKKNTFLFILTQSKVE